MQKWSQHSTIYIPMDSLDRVDLVSAKRKITTVGTLAPMAHSNLILLKYNENSSDQFKSTIIRKQIKNRTSFKIYVKTSENYKLVEIAIEVCATNCFVVVFEQSRDLLVRGEIRRNINTSTLIYVYQIKCPRQ